MIVDVVKNIATTRSCLYTRMIIIRYTYYNTYIITLRVSLPRPSMQITYAPHIIHVYGVFIIHIYIICFEQTNNGHGMFSAHAILRKIYRTSIQYKNPRACVCSYF